MTRANLLSIPNDEFMYWAAMESVDPIFKPWLANAWNCQVTANIQLPKKDQVEFDRWLPTKPAKKRQSQVEMISRMRDVIANQKKRK